MSSAPPAVRFVQALCSPGRLDAALGPALGRRTGQHLSTTYVALRLAGEASPGRAPSGPTDWQAWSEGRLAPFEITTWAKTHSLTYRRARAGLGAAALAGLLSFELHAGGRPVPGLVTIARDRVVHDRSVSEERFVQLSLSCLDALVADHGLDWLATALLVALLLRVSESTWRWCGTLAAFGVALGVGARSLSRGLRRLEAAGLIDELAITPGVGTSLRLVAAPGLVVAASTRVAAPERPRGEEAVLASSAGGGAPIKRQQRRQAERDEHRNGPAAQLAGRYLAHHRLTMRPSPALLAALEAALACGASPARVLEVLAARGTLAGANDEMAVLVARARQVAEDLGTQAHDDAERRTAIEQLHAQENAEWDASQAENAAGIDESRWLARQIPDDDLRGLRDVLSGELAPATPVALDLAARTRLRHAVALRPELVAAEALAGAVAYVLAGGALSTDGVGAALPRSRDGPTLAERFRQLS